MDYKQLLFDYLTKTQAKSSDDIAAIVNKKADDGTPTDEISETALSDLEELHAQHVKANTAEPNQAEYDRGHKAGKFDTLAKSEEKLKKLGAEGKDFDGMLKDLVNKSGTVSEDKILTSPQYANAVAEYQAKIEALTAEKENAVSEVTARFERQTRFTDSLPEIETAMAEVGVVMPQNPTAAATLKREFLKIIQAFDMDKQETGTYLKDADGKLQKDKHGHPVTLKTFVQGTAKDWFDIAKQPARQSPGNEDQGTAPAPKFTKDNVPKTQEEFFSVWSKMPEGQERTDLAVAFQASQTG